MSDSLRGNGKAAAKCATDALVPRIDPGKPPILDVTPTVPADEWVAVHVYDLWAVVMRYGAVLIRGLNVTTATLLAAVRDRMTTQVVADAEPFARRRDHARGVVSSADWPADQPMTPHHELSYALEFPQFLFYPCFKVPVHGGATTLADATAMLTALPQDLVAR